MIDWASAWNSRNPYAARKAPFLLKEYGGSLEGPLSKSASFFFIVDRAAIDRLFAMLVEEKFARPPSPLP